MHVEIQIAVNFVISFLYNKLPRRRVNQFGEELETALKSKYEDHWYPEKPYKGSAFRCIRCTPPLDPIVFEVAAHSSGMNLMDIQENLPQELSIWVDPGEVSYRYGEKNLVKILYSQKDDLIKKEIKSELNPEAKCFKPTESLMNTASTMVANVPINTFPNNKISKPVVFTTAAFAATKFGSTKLKNLGKKAPRTSPIDYNYTKNPHPTTVQHQPATQYSMPEMADNRLNRSNNHYISQSFESYDNWQPLNQDSWNEFQPLGENINKMKMNNLIDFSDVNTIENQMNETIKYETNHHCNSFNENKTHHGEQSWSKTSTLNYSDLNQNTWEILQFPFLNGTIWNDILNGEETSTITNVNELPKQLSTANINIQENVNKCMYSASSFSSTMSSPSLSTSNESNLINEFDNLSLNSNGSSN